MNEKPIQIEKYKGHKIKIYYDESPENPREWDNLGTMVCFHRRYKLGDKSEWNDCSLFKEWLCEMEKDNKIIKLPLYLLDHSGITISVKSFNDNWDSGQVGYIYVEKEKVKKEFGWTEENLEDEQIEKVEKILRLEVEIYNKYLTGEIYGYIIEGEYLEDSCWGFYYIKEVIELGKEEIDNSLEIHKKDVKELEEIGLSGYLVLSDYPFIDEESEE